MTTQLDAPLRLHGQWYLPDAPADRHFGTLTYDPARGLELDLRGHFRTEVALTADAPFRPPVVLGVADDGTACSLLDAVQVGHQTPLVGTEQRTLQAALLVTGAFHASVNGDLPVREMVVRLCHLEQWAQVDPFHWGFEDHQGKRRAVAEFDQPPTIEARIDGGALTVTTTLSSATCDERSLRWEAASAIAYIPDDPQDLREVLHRLLQIRDFATLHIGSPAWILNASFDPAAPEDDLHAYARRCRVTFQQPMALQRRLVRAHNVLLPLPALGARLGEAIVQWFALLDRIGPAVDLLLDSLVSSGHPVQKFLTVSRAFEMIHRGLVGGEYIPPHEYAAVYTMVTAAIPAGIPRGLRDRLKGSLKYGNEVSLRSRVKKAVNSLKSEHRDLLFPEGEAFAGVISDTRNYLTHLTDELRSKALHGPAVAIAADRLQMLTWVLVMRSLGHSDDSLVEAIEKDPTWAQRAAYAHGRKASANALFVATILAQKARRPEDRGRDMQPQIPKPTESVRGTTAQHVSKKRSE